MYKIDGTRIELTRGDSFYGQVSLKKQDGKDYEPQEGDVIRFALKKRYWDEEPLIEKTIPNDTLVLHLLPSDTKDLAVGAYEYDMEIQFSDGDVDTFINEATFILTPEVI